MPNLGRVHADFVREKKRDLSLKAQNRKKAEQEAFRLMKDKSDMFERYLKKPRNSSIGFLALSQLEKQRVEQSKKISAERENTDDTLISPPADGIESISINSHPKHKGLEFQQQ